MKKTFSISCRLLHFVFFILHSSFFISLGAQNLQKGDHYLYCHMNGGVAWTAYAISPDGIHFHDLIDGDSIFSDAEVATIEGRTRDAYIARKHNNKGFIMLTTDMDASNRSRDRLHKTETWDNYGINLLTSKDLIHWQSHTFDFRKGTSIFSNPEAESVYKDWSTINRVWAPHRMYYSYADADFTTLTQPRLLFDWGYATIDADINWVPADNLWHMMIKKEGGTPGLFTATAPSLTGPWSEPVEDDYVNFEGKKKCEGVSAFQLAGEDTWHIAYIEYSSKPRNYRICQADRFMRNFHSPQNIIGVARPQHGSFMRITKKEYKRLQKWSDKRMKQKK